MRMALHMLGQVGATHRPVAVSEVRLAVVAAVVGLAWARRNTLDTVDRPNLEPAVVVVAAIASQATRAGPCFVRVGCGRGRRRRAEEGAGWWWWNTGYSAAAAAAAAGAAPVALVAAGAAVNGAWRIAVTSV